MAAIAFFFVFVFTSLGFSLLLSRRSSPFVHTFLVGFSLRSLPRRECWHLNPLCRLLDLVYSLQNRFCVMTIDHFSLVLFHIGWVSDEVHVRLDICCVGGGSLDHVDLISLS